MYYYAYLNKSDIVEKIYDMPAPITGDQWVQIESHDDTLIGKRYNRKTGEFEEVNIYYYAILNEKDIVIEFTQSDNPIEAENMIEITAEQYNTMTIMGLWYNRYTKEFETPPVSIMKEHSTSQIQYKDENKWLDTKLDEMDKAIASGTGTSGENGATFTPAITQGIISWTNDKNLENPPPVDIIGEQGPAGTPGTPGAPGAAGKDGANGNDGLSPHIGENGHWYVGDVDTGVPAQGTATGGEDGKDGVNGVTFIPHMDANGILTWTNDGGLTNPPNMYLKGADGAKGATGAPGADGAPGPKGDPGTPGAAGATGADGATFIPSVSTEGDLSWSNNKGLANPSTMNIKGPQGPKGNTGANGADGAKGATGAPGTPGANGATYTPRVDSSGNLSWNNDKGLSNPQTVNIKGPQGEKGNPGAKGADGVEGPIGPRGYPGADGADGAPGPRGYDGADGADFNGSISGNVLRVAGSQCIYNNGGTETFGSSNLEHYLVGSKITSSRNIDSLSDARLKNVSELDLDAVRDFASKVHLVSYTFKDGNPVDKHIGVTAQQLLSIDKDMAAYFVHQREDGTYTVDYASLALLAILALQ